MRILDRPEFRDDPILSEGTHARQGLLWSLGERTVNGSSQRDSFAALMA